MSQIYLLTGGGTGGHVYPALAVAQAVRAADPSARFAYCGVRGGIEERIAAQNGIPFLPIVTAPYPGLRRPGRFLAFAVRIGVGTLQAAVHLLRRRPRTLVATGGYVAAPAVFAAVLLKRLHLLKLRIFVHEQNMTPGRLNRLVARFADVVGVSFHGSVAYLPGAPARYVGYPVRPALRAPRAEGTPEVLKGIPAGRRIVLAFGGSQGARTVNRALVDALPTLQQIPDIFVIHGVGRAQRSGYDPAADVQARLKGLSLDRPISDFYRAVPYINDIGDVYRAASLVVCRGGAGTIKELCALGRPAVVLPKAGLAGDHQVMNAIVLEQGGAARVLLEEPAVTPDGLLPAVSGVRLGETLQELLQTPGRLAAMETAAAALDDPDALSRILGALRAAESPCPEAPPHPAPEHPELQLAEMSPSRLLHHVRDARQRLEDQITEVPGFDYLQYRAASMITACSWRIRNVGVKLIGLLRLVELLPLLRYLYEDPSLASRFARAVGGDRQQNGFIRRNTMAALIQLGHINADVEAMVQAGTRDPYWETRREAIKAIRSLGAPLAALPWARAAVLASLKDHSFEVRIAAIRAIGGCWSITDGLAHLRPFYTDANWQLRESVLRAFEHWAQQGSNDDRATLRREFDEILLTAGGYRPVFGLKETARRASRSLRS